MYRKSEPAREGLKVSQEQRERKGFLRPLACGSTVLFQGHVHLRHSERQTWGARPSVRADREASGVGLQA